MLKGNEKLNISIVRTALNPVFKKYNIKKAVLFGSVAKDTNNIDSDVDVLVDSGLKGFNFLGLVEDMHIALNKPVDVFDVSHIIKGSKTEKEIENTGVIIYD